MFMFQEKIHAMEIVVDLWSIESSRRGIKLELAALALENVVLEKGQFTPELPLSYPG